MNAAAKAEKVARLLIVDDCARMRHAIRSVLNDLVREFFEADEGGAAIEAYFLHKPDWVTMDLAMVPVDGLTSLRQIKTRDPLARIIIVTVQDTKAFREAAWLAGACGYVLKDDLSSIRDVIVPPTPTP